MIVWAAVIFTFSSIPGLGTGLGSVDTVLRKGAHMAEYAILGLLARGESSGYDLARAADRSIAYMWAPSRSQIYKVLPRLVAWGLATAPWFGSYYADYVRGDYATALRWVESAERPGEAIIFNGPWQTLLFDHYYTGRLPHHILTGEVPLVEPQVAAALGELAGQYDGVWLLDYRAGKLLGTVIDRNQGKIVGWAEVDLQTEFGLAAKQDVHFMMTTGTIAQGQAALYVCETSTGKFGVYTMGAGDTGSGIQIRRHDMTTFRAAKPAVVPVAGTEPK